MASRPDHQPPTFQGPQLRHGRGRRLLRVAVLFGSTALLPQLLQTLMGYTPMNAGLVLSPAGLVTMLVMPMIGIALSKGVERGG